MAEDIATAEDITGFWRKAGFERWFGKDDAFDTDLRDRFLATHMAAARRELDHWLVSADGALALMILLDQFPRNCFRGTGHMYATDALAKAFAVKAIEAGHDLALEPELHVFFYLPLMHSELVADQEWCVSLCSRLEEAVSKSAVEHRDIVAAFGRFPHRNAMLGRTATVEEKTFLEDGGFAG